MRSIFTHEGTTGVLKIRQSIDPERKTELDLFDREVERMRSFIERNPKMNLVNDKGVRKVRGKNKVVLSWIVWPDETGEEVAHIVDAIRESRR